VGRIGAPGAQWIPGAACPMMPASRLRAAALFGIRAGRTDFAPMNWGNIYDRRYYMLATNLRPRQSGSVLVALGVDDRSRDLSGRIRQRVEIRVRESSAIHLF
jgi:hypothetical protein